jgi:2Fe-2S ferredoxin
MPKVTYILADGTSHTLEVPVGKSVMQAAVQEGVEGILADCGGYALCATCHVYVDSEMAGASRVASEDEDAMLEATASERLLNSRLSCQILITEEMNDLVVRVPERQI